MYNEKLKYMPEEIYINGKGLKIIVYGYEIHGTIIKYNCSIMNSQSLISESKLKRLLGKKFKQIQESNSIEKIYPI